MTARLPQHPEEDRLLELAYGELPATEARVLQQHVEGCIRCRQVLQDIAEVRNAVRAVPPEPAPERGLESLLAYGEQAAARARMRRRSFRWLGVLAAATAAGLVWVLLPAGPRERPAAQDTLARADSPARLEAPRAEMKAAAEGRENEGQAAAASGTLGIAGSSVAQRRKEAPKVGAAEPPAVAVATPTSKDERVQDDRAKSPSTPRDHTEAMRSIDAKKSMAESAPVPLSASPSAAAGNAQKTRVASEETVDKKQEVRVGERAGAAPPAALEKGASGSVAASDSIAEGRSAARVGTVSGPAPAAQPFRPADRPAKAARLDQVRREVAQSTGEQRKALLLEQCRLEAELLMGPAAVQTCSQVAREFPGTPEAKQATDLASGFSVQPAPR